MRRDNCLYSECNQVDLMMTYSAGVYCTLVLVHTVFLHSITFSNIISPVLYAVRKHVINFPSNLEVDVIDVTDVCKDVTFVTPLSLTEAF